MLWAASASAVGVLELSGSGADPDFCTIRITDPSGAADRRPVETLFDIFHDDKDASPTKYGGAGIGLALGLKLVRHLGGDNAPFHARRHARLFTTQLGRPSCRESRCTYVWISVVEAYYNKNKHI